MPRKRSEHVYGPYQERLPSGEIRWRVIYVDLAGRRAPESFAGEGAEGQAAAFAAEYRTRIAGRTVAAALTEYLDDCRDRGLRPSSLATTAFRLRGLLGVDEAEGRNGGPLAELRPAVAARLLEAWRQERSVDYVRNTVGQARTWGKWCVDRGWLKAGPFEGLKVKGRRKRGKPQHTIDEARRFEAYLLDIAVAPASPELCARRRWDWAVSRRQASVALLTALLLGPRAGEVVDRRCRELDDDGRILWIPDSKTEAGRRRLVVPEHLQPFLIGMCAGRQGSDRIFERSKGWLLTQCKSLCAAAGVPVVTPQGLRGTHASLATESGASALDVSRALGHAVDAGSPVTERHYTTADATAAGRQQRMLTVLSGGKR